MATKMEINSRKGQSVGRRSVPRLTNKLKVDDKFTPCLGEDGDEIYPNGIFEFNITKMIKYIQENPDGIILEEVRVNDFNKDFSSINESHMDSVDVSQPVILAEISPGRYNLIDGNHRMEKTRRMGVEKILAYKLNAEQHMRFLTSGRAYVAYVEYWNGKVKALKEQESE